MREQVIDKIQYFYNDRFSIIEECLSEFIDLNFNFNMIGIELDFKNGGEIIELDKSVGFNSSLIIPEIFEDLFCSFDLLKQGYFKNSKQILRNTLELLLQFLYNNILISENEQHKSNWLTRQRGVENIYDIIKTIHRKVTPEQKKRIKEIGKFYNLLNTATHSHKNQLNITKTLRVDHEGVVGFEHTEVVNCLVLFVSCFTYTLYFINDFYKRIDIDYYFLYELRQRLDRIETRLKVFDEAIENYRKGNYEKGEGFLIFKKNVIINGVGVLYSYRADYTIMYHSRNKVKQGDWKLIGKEIDHELFKKKFA